MNGKITFTDCKRTTWDVLVEQQSLTSWTIKHHSFGDVVCSCSLDSAHGVFIVGEFGLDTPERLNRDIFVGPFRRDLSNNLWYGERLHQNITDSARIELLDSIWALCLPDKLDHTRLKKQIVDTEGIRNAVDDVLTHQTTADLPLEDTHEDLP